MANSHPTERTGTHAFPALRGLAGEIRGRIVQSEIEGGLRLGTLKNGSRVLVETVNRLYELQVRNGQTWISGHPEFCPRPVPVRVRGSNWVEECTWSSSTPNIPLSRLRGSSPFGWIERQAA